MAAMNSKYTESELCTIVLNVDNLGTPRAFYASVQTKFPTDITKLTLQLTRVCDQNKEHKRLPNGVASRMGLKTKDGPGNRVSMNNATETILSKTKDNRKCGGGSPAAISSATRGGDAEQENGGGCSLCKKHSTNSPTARKTHPTKDCKKYNGDGTTKLFIFLDGRSSTPFNGKTYGRC